MKIGRAMYKRFDELIVPVIRAKHNETSFCLDYYGIEHFRIRDAEIRSTYTWSFDMDDCFRHWKKG